MAKVGKDVLSLGVKSKKVVAEAMVRFCCVGDFEGLCSVCCLSLQTLRNGRVFDMPVRADCP